MKTKCLILLVAFIAFIALSGIPAQAQCNRQCLEKMMKDYLAAMVKHDPARLPLASDARFIENT